MQYRQEKNHDLLLLYVQCSIDHRHENLDTFQFEILLLVVEKKQLRHKRR